MEELGAARVTMSSVEMGRLFGGIVGTGTIKGLRTPLSGLRDEISGGTGPTGHHWIRGGNWFCCISSVCLLRYSDFFFLLPSVLSLLLLV